MKRAINIVLMSVLAVGAVQAQDYGTPADPSAGFAARLKEAGESIESIECDFTQTRRMAVLARPDVSSGRFYYLKEGNICLEYAVPEGNRIVMSGGKFLITNGGRTSVVDNAANPMMRQLSGMLTACMTGRIDLFGRDSQIAYYENPDEYVVVIVPTASRVKKYMSRIVLRFDRRDMTLRSMLVAENETDHTLYEFTGKKLNGAVPAEKFTI